MPLKSDRDKATFRCLGRVCCPGWDCRKDWMPYCTGALVAGQMERIERWQRKQEHVEVAARAPAFRRPALEPLMLRTSGGGKASACRVAVGCVGNRWLRGE